jgi:hypothetical protein
VPDYRLYLLNPFSGHIDAVEEMSASDDIEAICLAQNGGRKVPVELWRGGVKVVHIDAPPELIPPAPRRLDKSGPHRRPAPAVAGPGPAPARSDPVQA